MKQGKISFKGNTIMKKTLATLFMGTSIVIGLAACSDGNDDTCQLDTAKAGDVKTLYAQRCSSCHGEQLEGRVGPNLTKIGSQYSKKQILEIIKNGKGGGKMPSSLVSGKDADQVAAWLAAKK